MKRSIFLGITVFLFAFIGYFFFYKQSVSLPQKIRIPVSEEKPFVIIIPSYNNSAYIEKNLHSVFSQKYTNYRVIYINDYSSDRTLEIAKELLIKLDQKKCGALISNPANYGALANLYNAIQRCDDHEIIIPLGGDDFFAHDEVLKRLNEAYQDPEVWLTYGNYLEYPSYTQIPKRCKKLSRHVVKNNSFRKAPWITPPLHSFYAALFKQIQLKDLFYRGHFFAMGGDIAYMLPMLEMAGVHTRHIDEIHYLKNVENPLNEESIHPDFKEECIQFARSKSPYFPLQSLPTKMVKDETADLVIFSNDRPLELYALLESLQRHVIGINKTCVLYQSSTPHFASAYLECKLQFPKVQFISQKNPHKDFKAAAMQQLFAPTFPKSRYIILALDTLVITDRIDITAGIENLEKTKAYGLYFSYHPNLIYSSELERYQPLPPHCPLAGLGKNPIPIAWQFSSGSSDWSSPGSMHFALYKKKDLKKLFTKLEYNSPETLALEWNLASPENAIGLFYPTAKCIAIKTPYSQKDFLKKFDQGLKIDLHPLFQISHNSQEITSSPPLIERE